MNSNKKKKREREKKKKEKTNGRRLLATSGRDLCLESIDTGREVEFLLGLLFRLLRGFKRGQTAADGTGLLGAEIEGKSLLGTENLLEFRALRLVDHGQNSCNALANLLDLGKLGRSTGRHFGDSQLEQLALQLLELLRQLVLGLGPQFVRSNLDHLQRFSPETSYQMKSTSQEEEKEE